MPTYQNSKYKFNLTYSSAQPAAGAVYTDSASKDFTITLVVGTGSTAVYYVIPTVANNQAAPTIGTLTKSSGTGDASTTLNSYTIVSVVTIGDVRLESGEIVATNKFLLNYPTGVSLLSAQPTIKKTIQSTKLTSTTTVTVPATYTLNKEYSSSPVISLNGNYKVIVYVGIGECTVQLNNSSDISRQVGLYQTYEIVCLDRVVESIIVTTSGTVYVTIELV